MSGEERRASILDAALQVFAEKGFKGARTREIAARAQISETLVFQHYANKQALYRAAMSSLFAGHLLESDRRIEVAAASQDDLGLLEALALHMVQNTRRDPRIVRLALFQALEGAGTHGHRTEPIDLLAKYLERRMQAGALRNDLDTRLVAHLFLMTAYMYVVERQLPIVGRPIRHSDEEVMNALARLFLEGMQRRRGSVPAG